MTIVRNTKTKVKRRRKNLWFERLMAFIAVINLLLVIFNLTYIPLRDFWYSGRVSIGDIKTAYFELEGIEVDLLPPSISQSVTQYDQVKGIVANRDTEQYLALVERLKQELAQGSEVTSKNVTNILGDLRRRSLEIIDSDPFAEAGKSGILEQIKNRMRQHLPNTSQSAKQAFWQFWSVNHLEGKVAEELSFFDTEIQPLFARNYYRYLSENGGYVDYFGFIDFPFGVIFGLEFLIRTLFISRRRTGVSWLDAMLWRWYDLFFLIPFWRWLRIIPVTIRLNQAKIINLDAIQRQASQGLVAGIAEDVTEVVFIRLIGQIQTSIRQGDIAKILSRSPANTYVDINNTNELAEIVRILAKVIAERVLPAIQPEAETLMQYSVQKALEQSSAYRGIKRLPGGERAVTNLSQQLVSQTYSAFSSALQGVLQEDKQFERLLDSLLVNINKTFTSELQAQASLDKIEFLLIDLLEEIKINYVERLSAEDVEDILEQTRSIRKIVQN
ncbi:hypothetical protein [Myxosarcina sp. GI1]|uniref:hypothetical protein n=1 Tax=Myxosarcina sp. GI1 TaxID=1541065 RepID=UPI0005690512|nr:hypothetical protein [Myxosarcina sp. GI1]